MTSDSRISEISGGRLWQFVASRRTTPARLVEFGLPKPNRIAHHADLEYLWYGPRTWLCRTSAPGVGAIDPTPPERLQSAGLLVEVTDTYATFRLEGAGASDLLAAGCAMDTATMPIGSVAATTVHHVRVLLIRLHTETCELVVPRSYYSDLKLSLSL